MSTTEKDKRSKTSKSRRETAVQGTNDSSIVSKCSMSLQGYFDDPYLQGFVSRVTRRAPLIHRGYYIRAKTIDFILKKFLESHPGDKQIISLGAGFDSAYFRLKSQGLLQETVFFEVDFPEVVKRKHGLIDSNPEMSILVGESFSLKPEESPHIEISSSGYKLVGADLSQANTLEAALKLCHIDFDLPTLLLSECVLTYMTRRTASGVVRWASETFGNSVFVLYEQINPTDAFGLFMQHHFQTVGSPLKCINFFPTIQSQKERFTQLGWSELEVLDMNEFYNNLLSDDEKARVEKLEMFDEYEEWHLKCAHYMVLLGYHGNCAQLLNGMMPQKDYKVKRVNEYKDMVEVSRGDSKEATSMVEVSGGDSKEATSMIQVSRGDSKMAMRRFGHATTELGNSLAVCVGGFGEQAGKHMRVTDMALIDSESLDVKLINPNVDNKKFEVSRMHATLSSLKDGRLILIGGRLSPMKLCSQMVALQLNSWKDNVNKCQNSLCMNCGNNLARFNEEISDPICEKMNSLNLSNNGANQKQASDEALCMNCSKMNSSNVKKFVVMNSSEKEVNPENKENIITSDAITRHETGSNKPVILNSCDTEVNCDISGTTGITSTESSSCENDTPVIVTVIEQNGDLLSPRWRHTAVVYDDNDTECIYVYGGRSQNVLALGDCYRFSLETYAWNKVETTGVSPEPRQSHSACTWKQYMVIAGGLNDNLQPLTSVHFLNLETNKWSKLECDINPRYSHTAHVIEDILVLIGGVSFSHDPPGVAMIHLPSGISAEFSLPAANKENLLMLHRHTSVFMDDCRILLLGGGGNCFSFGTHLNSSPVVLELTNCLQTMKQIIAGKTNN